MENRYKYLFKKMKCDIVSTSSLNHILLVDGYKKDSVDDFSMDVRFITSNSSYNAELTIDEITGHCGLSITLFNTYCSDKLLSYILSFLTSKEKCFYKMVNGITIYDYHVDLLDIKSITINNALIDDKTLDVINRYFKYLQSIIFNDCIIEENCNLYKLNSKLVFYQCEIQNIKSFNYCKQRLILNNSKINKITNSIINSYELQIDDADDLTLSNLFLLCHFPDLKKMVIGNTTPHCVKQNVYYEKCLLYLPYACPNLENLFIEGKISSFNFLYHFSGLNKCEIRSVNDSIGCYEIYNPYIVNKKERDKIINNSNCSINSELDINLIMYDRLQRILQSLSLFRYSQEEKQMYIKNDMATILLNPLKGYEYKSVGYFYLYNLSEKYWQLNTIDKDAYIQSFIVNNNFYDSRKQFVGRNVRTKQQIIISKPFIYHPSGIPILFDNNSISRQEYINHALNSMFAYYEDYETEDLKNKKNEDMDKKRNKYFNLLLETIIEHYDSFDTNELIQIFNEINLIDRKWERIESYYGIDLKKDDKVLETVDNKTGKKLVKYMKLLDMVDKQKKF